MKILLIHNSYQQAGGEDQVVRAETDLLRAYGHEVVPYTAHNDDVDRYSRMQLIQRLLWNREVYQDLRRLIAAERPDVMHVHNTFPLLSPSVYDAARAEHLPIVQTLHNYRLLCPNAMFFRQGSPCQDCTTTRVPWPGVIHACYRDSRMMSAGVATMLTAHRALGTWRNKVDVYIALSDFAREQFLAAGLSADKVVVKPNFLASDPGIEPRKQNYGLFVGRLSPEKGIALMLSAWEGLGRVMPLKIIGDGPLLPDVQDAADRLPGVEYLGRQDHEATLRYMQRARCLIFPSECYENFPMTIVEAYAAGLPVIASQHGSMQALVLDRETGLHFAMGDPSDLTKKVRWLAAHPEEQVRMGEMARHRYLSHYTATRNHKLLIDVYTQSMRNDSSYGVTTPVPAA